VFKKHAEIGECLHITVTSQCALCCFSLDNHNGSKKHMENVYLLQLEMADEDNLIDGPQEDIEVSEEDTPQLNNSRSK